MNYLPFLVAHAVLWLSISCSTGVCVGQEPEESNPAPLFSERTEEQVAQLLANAPPGADDGSRPGLKVFTSEQFPTGHQLAYLIASCACLCLLVPGAYIIYSSLQGRELTQERIAHLALTLCLLSLTWVLFVYSIAFSRNAHSYDVQQKEIEVLDRETAPGNLFIGDLGNSGLRGLLSNWGGGLVRHPVRRAGDHIPHSLFMTFQMMLFLQAVVPLLAIANHKQSSWMSIPLWLMWSGLVYAPLSYWTRGGGWLADCVDSGASVPLHIGVGFTALGLWAISRRQTEPLLSPVHRGLLITGSMLFLAGSLLLAACRSVAHAPWPTLDFLNVFLGGVSGVLLWLLVAQRNRSFLSADWPLGMIAGIVSVTAGCSSMPPTSAIIVGFMGVCACCLALNFRGTKQNMLWTLFAVYGISGYVGVVLAGVFSSPEIAGPDVAGKPIIGFIGGNVELLRVQLLTATVSAMVAFGGGLLLPPMARVIGYLLERFFSRESPRESSLAIKTRPHA